MSIYEYDEELHMKSEREIWYNNGKRTGLAEGREQGISAAAHGRTAARRNTENVIIHTKTSIYIFHPCNLLCPGLLRLRSQEIT